ncbi:MAG: hypothetical protein V2A34_15920, partial [Lentisphaerota bacterium]
MGVTKLFFDWKRCALDHAAEWLTRGWTSGPLDLRRVMILVPTRHAGRRLRERLASITARRGTAVLMGMVETPGHLVAPPKTEEGLLASEVFAEAFWRRTLAESHPQQVAGLGPMDFAASRTVRASAAEHLVRLRGLLCEEGYTLKSFAGKTPCDKERWACLAALEDRYLQQLAKASWRDDATEKLRMALHPVLPDELDRIIMLFVPDPPPLALKALEVCAARLPVDICIHAPSSSEDLFDDWGRPVPDRWVNEPLSLPPTQVEVCDDTLAMTEMIRQRVEAIPSSTRSCITIGIGDRATAESLEEIFIQREIPVFDPAGRPLTSLPLFTLMARLFRFQADHTYRSFMDLARHPDALARLEQAASAPNILLATLDEFQNQHMPSTFEDAVLLAGKFKPRLRDKEAAKKAGESLILALTEASLWMSMLKKTNDQTGLSSPLSKSLPATLSHIYHDAPADELLKESIKHLRTALEKLAHLEPLSLDPGEASDLLQRFANTQTMTAPCPD